MRNAWEVFLEEAECFFEKVAECHKEQRSD